MVRIVEAGGIVIVFGVGGGWSGGYGVASEGPGG